MSDEGCESLVDIGGDELHFAKLRRSRDGRRRILDIVESIDPAVAKIVVVHKPFMVTAKIVDQLVEPHWHSGLLVHDRTDQRSA